MTQQDMLDPVEPVARVLIEGGHSLAVYGYSRRQTGEAVVEVLGDMPAMLSPAEAKRLGSALFLAAQEATR